jgi:hypothetical protein
MEDGEMEEVSFLTTKAGRMHRSFLLEAIYRLFLQPFAAVSVVITGRRIKKEATDETFSKRIRTQDDIF